MKGEILYLPICLSTYIYLRAYVHSTLLFKHMAKIHGKFNVGNKNMHGPSLAYRSPSLAFAYHHTKPLSHLTPFASFVFFFSLLSLALIPYSCTLVSKISWVSQRLETESESESERKRERKRSYSSSLAPPHSNSPNHSPNHLINLLMHTHNQGASEPFPIRSILEGKKQKARSRRERERERGWSPTDDLIPILSPLLLPSSISSNPKVLSFTACFIHLLTLASSSHFYLDAYIRSPYYLKIRASRRSSRLQAPSHPSRSPSPHRNKSAVGNVYPVPTCVRINHAV